MSDFTRFIRYPQLTLCSLLLVALGAFGAVYYLYTSIANQQVAMERYCKILATSTARQAVDATINQDMVSLQAILQETAQYPYVVGTSLHNVDNKLLVQSGYKPNQVLDGRRYSYTAPVALHNNVAGYLEVTLQAPKHSPEDERFLSIWAGLVTLCLLVIWWSIHRRWWKDVKDKLPSADSLVTAVVDKLPQIPEADLSDEFASTTQDATEIAKEYRVRLNLHLLNMGKLYQQLNHEGFSLSVRRIEKPLNTLLALYSGKRQNLHNETLAIDFTGDSESECSFRAICFAQIILNIAAKQASPRLHLSACIHGVGFDSNQRNSLLTEYITEHNNQMTANRGEILINKQLLSDDLQAHADINPTSGMVNSIKAPYKDFVAKQEEQISARG